MKHIQNKTVLPIPLVGIDAHALRITSKSNNSSPYETRGYDQNQGKSISERSIEKSGQENLSCVNEELEKPIVISVNDLLDPLRLDSIPENQPRILRISSHNEIKQLQIFLSDPTAEKLVSNITELEFDNFTINNDTFADFNNLLLTVQNSNFFHSFTSLSIWKIESNTNFNLPPDFNKLRNLSIDSIDSNVNFILQTQLNKLKSLSVRYIERGVQFAIQKSLDELESLSLSCISSKAFVTLTGSLNKLKTLKVGSIYNEAQVTLPTSLDSLESLSIDYVGFKSRLILPTSLNNLEIFSVSKIDPGITLTFPEVLKKLKELCIGTIGKNVILKLPESLDALKSLTMSDDAYLLLKSVSLKNLKDFCIRGVNSNFDLTLPELERLTIMGIAENVVFRLPNTLNNLKSLFISGIEKNATLVFPKYLDALKMLSVENINRNAKFELPDSLNNLQSFCITNIHPNAIYKLPKSFNNFIHLAIKQIFKGDTLQLLDSLNKLESFSIGEIYAGATIKLPKSLSNLKSLSIEKVGFNARLILPETLDSLETLIIKEMHASANIKLPISFKSLTNLTIGTQENNITRQLLHKVAYNRCLKTTEPPSLFERFYSIFPQLTSEMLFENDLQTILAFRSVSKKICELITLNALLAEKAKITFWQCQFHPVVYPHPSVDKKFDFAKKEKPTMDFIISVNDLLDNNLLKLSPLFKNPSIQEEKLHLILKIANLKELNQFSQLLQEKKEFASKIQKLDLRPITVKEDTSNHINLFLDEVSKNLYFLSKLTSLTIGDIRKGAELKFSDLLLDCITDLAIGNLWEAISFELPRSFNNLVRLSIGNVDDNVVLKFPDSLNGLESLSIGTIRDGSTIKLSVFPPKLKNLTIREISDNVTLDLPSFPESFTNFNIGSIGNLIINK